MSSADVSAGLADQFQSGLAAPICLTWELTYACNLACVHCLSSSGRRGPTELSTDECRAVIDELEAMQVFHVNIGGGEPTVRPDFWEVVEYSVAHHVGVKFSTNGVKLTRQVAGRLAGSDYVDVQVSLDGATAEVNDAVRGVGSFDMALRAMSNLADAGFRGFKISVVMTRQNVTQLDQFNELADRFGAVLRITRLRPSGRGAQVWEQLHPTADQQRKLYSWLMANGEQVLTGDVYACPFAIHRDFLAGNVRGPGGFAAVWKNSELFGDLRRPQSGGACASCGAFDSCRGGCMAAKFFTGLPLDGPDPECVKGFGTAALDEVSAADRPLPSQDHSHRKRSTVALSLGWGPTARPPDHLCDESPLAGFQPARRGTSL